VADLYPESGGFVPGESVEVGVSCPGERARGEGRVPAVRHGLRRGGEMCGRSGAAPPPCNQAARLVEDPLSLSCLFFVRARAAPEP